MKIILTGSLGHISKPVTEQLVKLGHAVTVISHSAARAAQITALGATPAIGSIDDEAFLTRTFQGTDAVYLMITAATTTGDIFEAGRQEAMIYANAVKAAGVKQVVNLSSVGANLGPEVGALHIYNIIEGVLTAELPGVNLTFIRPTGMYYNLFGQLATIRQDHAIYTNSSLTKPNSWVAPVDIAPVVVQALTAPAAGTTVQYVASDEKTYPEVAAILATALGMPDLKVIQISDEQLLKRLTAVNPRTEFFTQYVKMTAYERDHDFYVDYRAHQPVLGPTKLTDFATTFAKVYHQQASAE
ncbi:NAD(P)H-binding protein [Lactiplantibacillus sp. WILCCON 0030]|uniref:NAD(P)H-binding protein n=1 Tax=Lactiplantibacillus brownii TaxID=3069269 RepID=A0ABU1A7S9_9LACO|nr:NmrA family NAD(P)-binding protein [Lactiplantibacillus brownii]MDQ7937007.1 NAD(P)H-binding protein [Lactiplantibacillus brownii]